VRVHCDREGNRKCLRLTKIGVISDELPEATGRAAVHGTFSRPQTVQFDRTAFPMVGVPEFRQERSARARDVQDRVGNRWHDAVSTAIAHMSTNAGSLAEVDRSEPLDIPLARS